MAKTKNESMKKKEGAAGTIAAVSAGVIALAAASYFFFGPEGKKNRNSLRGWMVKMKGEVIEKMEDAKDMSEAAYAKLVDTVAKKYAKTGKVSEKEIHLFADTLKQQWQGIVKAHNKAAAVVSAAKTVARQGKKAAVKVAASTKAKKAPKAK